MENKTIKNLIILGIIIFSFALADNAYAVNYAFSNDPVVRYNPNNSYYNNYNELYGYRYNPVNNHYPYYSQNYPQYSYYQQSVYNPPVTVVKPNTPVVNNYYYQTAPATVAKTTTTTKTNTDTSNTSTNKNTTTSDTDGVYNNSLGASAYNGSSQANGNGLTALSLRGSGGFMPSSIWQWLLVIILILTIIIISRMFVRKPSPADHDSHVAHAH